MGLNLWAQSLAGIEVNVIKKALDFCRMNLEWPPSIAEFINICEEIVGIPSMDEVIRLCVARDFSHPLVKMVFDLIGSWSFSNDRERDLRQKVEVTYKQCRQKMRMGLNQGNN